MFALQSNDQIFEVVSRPHCLKSTQNVALVFWILSGNIVWPQVSGFKKLVQIDHFWHFWLSFVQSKCNRSSLRSQCRMRPFLSFSNTVPYFVTVRTTIYINLTKYISFQSWNWDKCEFQSTAHCRYIWHRAFRILIPHFITIKITISPFCKGTFEM